MELADKIDVIENDVAGLKADVCNLKGWQKTQNGTIHRVEAKVEKLLYWIMGVMVTCIFTLITLFVKG
jgi:hypothetical protein